MIAVLILYIAYFALPVILIWLSNKYYILNKIGPVLLAYALGLVLGNIKLVQVVDSYAQVQENVNSITILLAIPLLLFSIDIKTWFKQAGKAVIALFVLLFSVVVSVVIGYFLFHNNIDQAWKVSGMLMGVYSGGTPNLAAVQSMLKASEESFILINTLDIFVSATYLLFLMTAGKYLFRKFLPKYKNNSNSEHQKNYDEDTHYKGILQKRNLLPLLKALMLSFIIVGVSIGLSFLILHEISMLVIILAITTLSIAASFLKQINSIAYTFQTGMYFIVVFCLVVASMANISELGAIAFDIFIYIVFVVFGSLLIKLILSKIFKIDADTLIVASSALICSPPFVPVMAGVLKNKQIIVTGLTIGIIGYALGNYLGVAVAYILK